MNYVENMTLLPCPNTSLTLLDIQDKSEVVEALTVLVSEQARLIFQWVCYTVLLGVISCFGTISNIINIICFVKQGLNDSVNVSLLGLAISDLGCVVTMLWTSICFNPAFHQSDLPFDSIDVSYLTGGWTHIIFARITSWITAFITLERCLCIATPLKVKSMITPTRTLGLIISIFIIFMGTVSPVYYVSNLAMKYSPERNKTILGLVFKDDRAIVEAVSFAMNNLFIPFGAFFMVIICTIILVLKLQSHATWRKTCTGPKGVDSVSDRDQRVAKMVVTISTLFIICFIPICFTSIVMIAVPEVSIHGHYKNLLYIIVGLSFALETTNSAMNIFIYYHRSTRYRKVFQQLFDSEFCSNALERRRF